MSSSMPLLSLSSDRKHIVLRNGREKQEILRPACHCIHRDVPLVWKTGIMIVPQTCKASICPSKALITQFAPVGVLKKKARYQYWLSNPDLALQDERAVFLLISPYVILPILWMPSTASSNQSMDRNI